MPKLRQDTFFIGRLINKAMRASPRLEQGRPQCPPILHGMDKECTFSFFFSINLYLKQAECFDI